MSVITISRGSYTGGKMLAESLAQKLSCRCIDRDLIVQKAAASGIPADELRYALETPPTFLGLSRHDAYVYLAVIQATLAEEIREGNVIYHGLAGHLLLKDVPNVLRVRLIAPMEFRVGKVQAGSKMSRKEALDYIAKMDDGRHKWTRSLYGVAWEDPALYDVVINLDRIDVAQATDAICALIKLPAFQFTPEAQQAIDDLAIASRVRAKLATHTFTSQLELDIKVSAGTVVLQGSLTRVEQAGEIERIARSVPGVRRVRLDRLALAFARM